MLPPPAAAAEGLLRPLPTRAGPLSLSKPLLGLTLTTIQRDSTESKSEDTLISVIDSDISSAQEFLLNNKAEDVPEDFPFEIQDEPGQQTVTLTWEYKGKTITVEVHTPIPVTPDVDDSETERPSKLPLLVRVSKSDGPGMEFRLTAFADDFAIDRLYSKAEEDQIAFEGPNFGDLDEDLQKAFHKYLEVRGIHARTTSFLFEYMINKYYRECVSWLKNVKKGNEVY